MRSICRPIPKPLVRGVLLVLAAVTLAPWPASASGWPEITAADRALSEVPREPSAPAVVLHKNAEMVIQDLGRGTDESRVTVEVRLKILSEEGREYADVAIPHSSYSRLKKLEGRTVLPDGRELPLAEIHLEEASRRDEEFVSVATFDGVEVGAILDYRYVLRLGSIYNLEPWYFQDRVPTMHSEITFLVPSHMAVLRWFRETVPGKMKSSISTHATGQREVKVWMDEIPGVPAEAYGLSFAELSSQFLLVPTSIVQSGVSWALLDSWGSVCELHDSYYGKILRADRNAKRKARELAPKGTPPRQAAAAIYHFVRDEVRLERLAGEISVDKVLEAGRGDGEDQGLLLYAMLDAVKLDPRLVWAAPRGAGIVDMTVPNPAWFDRNLVRIEIAGEEIFLDPTDRRLGFGQLSPLLEGMDALLYHRSKPKPIVLPTTPWESNTRRAVVDLELDDQGALSGTGRLELTGHHAWHRARWNDAPESAWSEWLGERYPDFEIADVSVDEQLDDRRITVGWRLAQPAEDVLGDESSLRPSQPLSLRVQPFLQAPVERRSPVRLPFPDRDDVELSLTWPASWMVEATPRAVSHPAGGGALTATIERDDEGRTLTYRRRFDLHQHEVPLSHYTDLRQLFAAVVDHDAQDIVLVRH